MFNPKKRKKLEKKENVTILLQKDRKIFKELKILPLEVSHFLHYQVNDLIYYFEKELHICGHKRHITYSIDSYQEKYEEIDIRPSIIKRNNQYQFIGSFDGQVEVIDENKSHMVLDLSYSKINDLLFYNNLLYVAPNDESLRILEIKYNELREKENISFFSSINNISKSDNYMAFATDYSGVLLHHYPSLEFFKEFKFVEFKDTKIGTDSDQCDLVPSDVYDSCSISKDEKLIAGAGSDNVLIWEIETSNLLYFFQVISIILLKYSSLLNLTPLNFIHLSPI